MGKSKYIPVALIRPPQPKLVLTRCLGPGKEHQFLSTDPRHHRRCEACEQKIRYLSKRDALPQHFGGDASDFD